ncbi:hypothetical protein AVEN_59486-1 [Araneus ventricosus]|uniref:Uncharacterized protein n=1 Tax=Araneus ventricosus TaxID=182803 RepID=A0A4Y2TT61_ARAVE|nr:hypothetical protein AVEN_59486-1 [Araneus ventricosus]
MLCGSKSYYTSKIGMSYPGVPNFWKPGVRFKGTARRSYIRPILEEIKFRKIDHLGKKSLRKAPATKRYWALWDSLHLKDGVFLYHRKWESDDGSSCRWQLILPKSKNSSSARDKQRKIRPFGVMKTLGKPESDSGIDFADVEKVVARDATLYGAEKDQAKELKGRCSAIMWAPFERMALDIF